MKLKPFTDTKRPFLIAGPCSAETEAQVLATAEGLKGQGINLFRAGIWKPRTRPDSFEGVGEQGLPWLQKVKAQTGLKVTTEVANAKHVEAALKHDVDVLWIGARTTVNPFSVQAIADALRGVDIPVLVKNPINPDLKLWIGAMERLQKVGIESIGAIHRGFSYHGESEYRNIPRWQIALDLKRLFPELTLMCDNSHICGRRDTLRAVAQLAMDLNYDGLMTEVHPTPDAAWSDAAQQITPQQFAALVDELVLRNLTTDDEVFTETIDGLRHQIDDLDDELFGLIAQRMALASKIGEYKRKHNISVYQPERWNYILERFLKKADSLTLSRSFISSLLKAIHQESIDKQEAIMNEIVEAKEDSTLNSH